MTSWRPNLWYTTVLLFPRVSFSVFIPSSYLIKQCFTHCGSGTISGRTKFIEVSSVRDSWFVSSLAGNSSARIWVNDGEWVKRNGKF